MDALKALSKELGYPSGDKLWRAVERKGLPKSQGQRFWHMLELKVNDKSSLHALNTTEKSLEHALTIGGQLTS
jgi:hypothetical protein